MPCAKQILSRFQIIICVCFDSLLLFTCVESERAWTWAWVWVLFFFKKKIVVSILFAFIFGVFFVGCGSVRGDCVWVGWRVAREDVQRAGEGESEQLFFSRCAWQAHCFDRQWHGLPTISQYLRQADWWTPCRRVVPVGHGIDGVARHRHPTRPGRRSAASSRPRWSQGEGGGRIPAYHLRGNFFCDGSNAVWLTASSGRSMESLRTPWTTVP